MTGFLIALVFGGNNMTPYIYAGLHYDSKWKFKNQIKESNPLTIIEAVSRILGIDEKAILSVRRDQDICEARCIAMSLILKANPELRLKEVGHMFNRDHSTVIHNRNLFEDLMYTNKDFINKVNKVKMYI